jgi:hypothetical protein
MGTIVCQSCERTIEHFEEEKVTTLYATSTNCTCDSERTDDRNH